MSLRLPKQTEGRYEQAMIYYTDHGSLPPPRGGGCQARLLIPEQPIGRLAGVAVMKPVAWPEGEGVQSLCYGLVRNRRLQVALYLLRRSHTMRSMLKLIAFASTSLFVLLQVAIVGTTMFSGLAMASSTRSLALGGTPCLNCCSCSAAQNSANTGIGRCTNFRGKCPQELSAYPTTVTWSA